MVDTAVPRNMKTRTRTSTARVYSVSDQPAVTDEVTVQYVCRVPRLHPGAPSAVHKVSLAYDKTRKISIQKTTRILYWTAPAFAVAACSPLCSLKSLIYRAHASRDIRLRLAWHLARVVADQHDEDKGQEEGRDDLTPA